jgi:2-hydroxy-6-oxonona-2,4-dienedioate hydrolase
MLCLHGAGSRADRFRRNLVGLADAGFHVYAMDFPGHGFASKSAEAQYTAPAFASVVEDVIDELGLESPVLVGTSLGGHVAAIVAMHRPDAIPAIALIGTVGIVRVDRDAEDTSGRVTDTSEAGVRGKLEFLLYDRALITDAWVREEARINTSPGAEQALARVRSYLDGPMNDDLVGTELAELDTPTILIWGEHDRWVAPEIGREIKTKLLPEAPLVYLAAAGHAPYYERPEAFNQVVTRFVDDPSAFGSNETTL